MAEYTISGIRLQNGDLCTLKDPVARAYHEPTSTKTYTDVIGTANENRYAGFFYLKVTPTSFRDIWRVRTRIIATVPGSASNADLYKTESTFEVWGSLNAVSGYDCANKILSTNYRPIYYNSVFLASETGYNNGCSHWIGFNLLYSTNPINTSYKRQIVVELYDHNNCTVELQDSLITPDDIPNRAAHTNWYTSSNTSYSNYDACSQGIKQIGDSNTTSINLLYRQHGNYIADSAIGRYELLFHVTRDRLTALNNSNNDAGTTKAMLTNVAFNPFLPVYYYNTTTVLAADAAISASSLYFHGGVFDARYTFNCGLTLVANKDIFAVAQPVGDGTCKIVSPFWTQDLPSTSDGKWYILIGRVYDTYRFQLYQEHPVYMHDGTKVVEVHNAKNIGDSATVNGHTVAKDVPSDAMFTDTVYTHPTTSGYKHIPTGGSTGQILKWSSDGTAQWADSSSGLPSGGSAGQVLKKSSSTDYDTEWGSIPSPLPSGGSASQVLAKNSNNTALTWAGYAVPGGGSQGQVLQKSSNVTGATSWGGYSVPAGGSTGQVLKKSSDTDGATSWAGYAVPTGGSTNQILAKNSNTNGDLKWINNNSATFPTGGSASQVLRRNGVNSGLEWAGYAVPTGGLKGQFLCKNSDSNGDTNWVNLPLRVTLGIYENSSIPGEYLIQHASEEIYDDPFEICVAFSQGKLMVIENFANIFDENDYGSDGYICDAGTGTLNDNGIDRSFTFLKVKCIKQNGVEIEKYFAGYEDDTYGYSVRDVTDQFPSGGSSLPSGGAANQVLRKNNTNTGEEWGGYAVPAGGSQGQALVKQANNDGFLKWETLRTLPSTDGATNGDQLEKSNLGVGYAWVTRYHVPTGGSFGQVLYKTSNSNGALGWKDVVAIPTGGSANQVLKKNSSNSALEWGGYSVPAGGSTGQVLKKTSSTNGAVEWGDPLTNPEQFHCFYGTYDNGGTVKMGWMQLAIVFEIYRINNDEPARYSISEPSGMDFSELLNAHRAGRPIVLMDSSLEEDPENTIFYTVCELVEGEEVNDQASYILKARRTKSDGTVSEKHLKIFYETEEYYWYLAEDITPTDYVSRTLVIGQTAYNTLVNNNTVDPHTLYCIKEAT